MVTNTRLLAFSPYLDEQYGSLVALEQGSAELPFALKRAYYIYDVPRGTRRGFHAHADLEQVLVCAHGQATILVKTPFEEEEVLLDTPAKGLYIGPMIWREMFDFSEGAVLLVLASKPYCKADYIRDYDAYAALARAYFQNLP